MILEWFNLTVEIEGAGRFWNWGVGVGGMLSFIKLSFDWGIIAWSGIR